MGLHDASGQLEKAVRQLLGVWYHTKESWGDVKMSAFEERYITTIQQDARLAMETIARMGAIIDQIRRDCSDREAL